MRKLMTVAVMAMLVAGAAAGCNKNKSDMNHKHATTQMAAGDDCPMCPGVQHANEDGTCPKCGMKVKG